MSNEYVRTSKGNNDECYTERYAVEPLLEFLEPYKFTKTEENIIKELRNGYSNKKIAEKLKLSVNTVNTYLGSIYKRLGINNRIQLLNEISKRNLF